MALLLIPEELIALIKTIDISIDYSLENQT